MYVCFLFQHNLMVQINCSFVYTNKDRFTAYMNDFSSWHTNVNLLKFSQIYLFSLT